MTELYAILVLKYKLSPAYVLDYMQLYEAKALLKYEHYSSRDSWEQSRLVAYVMAQVNSTKKLKPTDIMKFAWDGEEHADIQVSDEDVIRLQEQAKAYLDNNKNIDTENNGQ